jgi:hypothetical protein
MMYVQEQLKHITKKHGFGEVVPSRSCPSGGAHVKFGWWDRHCPTAELGEVVPCVATGRMGWRHPLGVTSREGGASWRRETRKEVGGAGVVKGDVVCGVVARVPGSRMRRWRAGQSATAQQWNRGAYDV